MDDQMMVGVRDAVAHPQEQPEPVTQIDRCSVNIDGLPVHIFHGQIGAAVFGVAGVNHVDDGRVVERREELAFLQETIAPCRPMDTEELHGDLLLNFTVDPLGQINGAHATGAEQPNQAIRPTTTKLEGAGRLQQLFRCTRHASGKVLMIVGIEPQQ